MYDTLLKDEDGETSVFDTHLLLKKIGAFSASLRLVIVGLVIVLVTFESIDFADNSRLTSGAGIQVLGSSGFYGKSCKSVLDAPVPGIALREQDVENKVEANRIRTTSYEGTCEGMSSSRHSTCLARSHVMYVNVRLRNQFWEAFQETHFVEVPGEPMRVDRIHPKQICNVAEAELTSVVDL